MLLGIETEYGIHAPEVPDLDPVLASAMVVQNCPVASTRRSEPYDCMLVNGARFYVDHAHPEYAGPEVTNATDAVGHDLAGDRIVAAAARQASRELGVDLRIYKNNTDSKG
ncbi:MAG: proteasome accessory factor PafA2 family protein, partial [Propionicimonas sp.]